jgi:hypothetical protein
MHARFGRQIRGSRGDWTQNGKVTSTSASYTFTMPSANVTLTAHFKYDLDDAGVQVGHLLVAWASRAICVHLLHVAMTTGPRITDHLFVPLGITVKQLWALPFQVVQ